LQFGAAGESKGRRVVWSEGHGADLRARVVPRLKPRLSALRATGAEAHLVGVLQDASPAEPAPSAGLTRRIKRPSVYPTHPSRRFTPRIVAPIAVGDGRMVGRVIWPAVPVVVPRLKPRLSALRATGAEAHVVGVLQDASPAEPAPSAGFTRRINGAAAGAVRSAVAGRVGPV